MNPLAKQVFSSACSNANVRACRWTRRKDVLLAEVGVLMSSQQKWGRLLKLFLFVATACSSSACDGCGWGFLANSWKQQHHPREYAA